MRSTTGRFNPAHALALFLALNFLSVPARAVERFSRLEVELGIEVARHGMWREAIFRWQKAVELDPENAAARNNLAVAYEQEGEFQLADQEYQRALGLDAVYIRQNYELFREAYEKRNRVTQTSGR